MSNKSLALPAMTRFADNAPLIVVCLLLIDSLHFVFARLLLPHLPPVTSAFYVLGLATVQLSLFVWFYGGVRWETFRRSAWVFLTIGFLIAASTTMNFAAVEFIDPGMASLLAKSSVLFGLGFSLIWLKERLNRWQILGVVVALIGVFVITFQPGDYFRVGSILVLVSTMLYSLHTALVKRYTAHIGLVEFFFFRLLATSGFLFIFTAAGNDLIWPSRSAWLILITAATVDVVISRALYYQSLRQLNLSMHTIVLTLSPVVAVIWSVLFFDSQLTKQQVVGGLAILAGVALVTLKQGASPARQPVPAGHLVESGRQPPQTP